MSTAFPQPSPGTAPSPHLIVNIQRRFKQSPVLDSDQRFSATLDTPGTYDYFCSRHPKMQGKVIVQP